MALPSSGTISMYQVATELGISSSNISLNHGSVRALAGKTSGSISMSDLHGKSSFSFGRFTVQRARSSGSNIAKHVTTKLRFRIEFVGATITAVVLNSFTLPPNAVPSGRRESMVVESPTTVVFTSPQYIISAAGGSITFTITLSNGHQYRYTSSGWQFFGYNVGTVWVDGETALNPNDMIRVA